MGLLIAHVKSSETRALTEQFGYQNEMSDKPLETRWFCGRSTWRACRETTQMYRTRSQSRACDAEARTCTEADHESLRRSAPVSFGDISNDVGSVKRHHVCSGRRSRLSRAKSRRRRPCFNRQRGRCPLPSTLGNLSHHHVTVLPTTHLFGHNGTMMTRANSRYREAGCPFILSVTDCLDHVSTQAIPQTGLHRTAAGAGARRQNSV